MYHMQVYHYFTRRNLKLTKIISAFHSHSCEKCSAFITLFEPVKEAMSEAERAKAYRTRQANTLKFKEKVRHQGRAKGQKYIEKKNAQLRARYIEQQFPPKPLNKDDITNIINGFCNSTSFSNIEEHGCAVCGKLTLHSQLSLLKDLPSYLFNVLNVSGVTCKERKSNSDPFDKLTGLILFPDCSHICDTCLLSLQKGKVPNVALANGL